MTSRNSRLLDKALFEAARAEWLFTAPNPRVGAIALKDGHIVGRGHHQRFGGPHAEEAALRNAGAWDDQAGTAKAGLVDEMIVTLEPCSSTEGKKRSPCTHALIDAGVKRVTIGALDPDPRHAGGGVDVLCNSGILVDTSLVATKQRSFEEQNPAFLRGLSEMNVPWVLLKWASSVDGKTATDLGVSQWITAPESREEVHQLRALGEATMAGKKTLIKDNPSLTARPSELVPDIQPLRIAFGVDSPMSADSKFLQSQGSRLWIIGENDPSPSDLDPLLRVPRSDLGLDPVEALKELRSQYGIRRLFVEGGSLLHGSLLTAGLVHAIVRYEAPILLGGHHAACAGPSFPSPQEAARLLHEERRSLGPDLRRAFLLDSTNQS